MRTAPLRRSPASVYAAEGGVELASMLQDAWNLDSEVDDIGEKLVVNGTSTNAFFTEVVHGNPQAILIELLTEVEDLKLFVVYEINKQRFSPFVWTGGDIEVPRSLVWDGEVWHLFAS